MRNLPLIRRLLADADAIREDLVNARSADEANGYRADLRTNEHSLFLAGYETPSHEG